MDKRYIMLGLMIGLSLVMVVIPLFRHMFEKPDCWDELGIEKCSPMNMTAKNGTFSLVNPELYCSDGVVNVSVALNHSDLAKCDARYRTGG